MMRDGESSEGVIETGFAVVGKLKRSFWCVRMVGWGHDVDRVWLKCWLSKRWDNGISGGLGVVLVVGGGGRRGRMNCVAINGMG